MQYLLTEEEMADIRNERLAMRMNLPGGSLAKHLEALKDVCQKVATTMVSLEPFNPHMVGKPYGCIHVNRRESYGYCDRCPVAAICPQDKDWSQ